MYVCLPDLESEGEKMENKKFETSTDILILVIVFDAL